MKTTLSSRLQHLPISSIRKLIPLSDKAEQDGVKIYHLNMGQPDVKTPQVMIDALKAWDTNPIAYAPSGGTKEYINALKQYYHSLGFDTIDAKDILGTVAGSEAINMAMYATCDGGDEMLVFEPFYSTYKTSANLWNINLVAVSTTLENGFHLPPKEEITRFITPKTKAILYSNPGNPTGTVYTKEEVKMLVTIAKEHNLYLISDEVYREYSFVDRPYESILQYLQDIPEQAILIDSLSKRYNLCGARLGALISKNAAVIKGSLAFAMSRLSGGIIDMHVGAQLTKVPAGYIPAIQQEYKRRRDTLYEGLKEIEGVIVAQPEGAFYIMAQLPVEDAEQFCIWLLEKFRDNDETVMLAPGYGFYADLEKGKQMVRLAYVLEVPQLKRSVELLKKALQQYR